MTNEKIEHPVWENGDISSEISLLKNESVKQYFLSLPSYVQESINETGVPLNSEAELKNYAQNLLSNK